VRELTPASIFGADQTLAKKQMATKFIGQTKYWLGLFEAATKNNPSSSLARNFSHA